MSPAGGGSGEYAVEAARLDSSFIGQQFGYNCGERTVYGTLAGVEISRRYVTVWLADVPDDCSTLRLVPSDTLYFAHPARGTGWRSRASASRHTSTERRSPSGRRA